MLLLLCLRETYTAVVVVDYVNEILKVRIQKQEHAVPSCHCCSSQIKEE